MPQLEQTQNQPHQSDRARIIGALQSGQVISHAPRKTGRWIFTHFSCSKYNLTALMWSQLLRFSIEQLQHQSSKKRQT